MREKRHRVQWILVFIGTFLILATYFYYPYINRDKTTKNQAIQKNFEETFSDDQGTTFENVEYKGLYDLDKPFEIRSEKAHIIDEKEPDILHMMNMQAILHLSDGRIVSITSDKGRYNKITNDCFFEENVKATDGETIILAENLDLLATKNYVEVYNNVRLNHISGALQADKVDYNFETKYFKVSMFDENAVKMKVIR